MYIELNVENLNRNVHLETSKYEYFENYNLEHVRCNYLCGKKNIQYGGIQMEYN